MSTAWRFAVVNGEILRARPYRLSDDGDSWRWYWDSDTLVAFTVEYGVRRDVYATTDGEDTDRAIAAYRTAIQYAGDVSKALKSLAVRLTGQHDSDFIHVGLDRSTDLYALTWGEDVNHVWRNEIESLYHGEVYRVEVEKWNMFTETWDNDDDVCDEWYGEDLADAAWREAFPLDAIPAEFHIAEQVGA